MLIFWLLGLGAVAALALRGRHDDRAATAISRGECPSPIAVMSDYLRRGEPPPPVVAVCAIAEAESTGRQDLAREIAQAFVAPVVAEQRRAQLEAARRSLGRGTSPPAWSPMPMSMPMSMPASMPASMPPPSSAATPAARSAPEAPPWSPDVAAWDPWAAYGEVPGPPTAPFPQGAAAPAPTHDYGDADLDYYGQIQAHQDEVARATAEHQEHVEAMAREAAAAHAPAQVAGSITVLGKSSPIEGVSTRSWLQFVGGLARELPTFTARQHVGQFRHRRERLRSLGLDEATVGASSDAQVDALGVDMADAHGRARRAGMFDRWVGCEVDLPYQGKTIREAVSTSGVLALIQAAGFEGAEGWLSNPGDRAAFPGTTAAFMRVNGLF